MHWKSNQNTNTDIKEIQSCIEIAVTIITQKSLA